MARIAFIGGGSLVWIPRFTHDLLCRPELAGSTLVLMDVDPASLELMAAYARRMIAERGGGLEVVTTTVRDEALAGADFVVSTFMAGGHRAWADDLNIALKHGVRHPKGMSVGPGGLLQGLKAIPQLLDLAWAMERICPQAPLFNFTNPMSSISLALQRHSSIKTVGVCHGVLIALEAFSHLLGVDRDDLICRAAGVNHLNWVLEVRNRQTGEELLPEIMERIAAQPLPESPEQAHDMNTLRAGAEAYRVFGGIPVPGDFHVTEFFPYFLRPGLDLFEAYGIRHNYVENRIAGKTQYVADIKTALAGTDPVPAPRGESLEKLDEMILSVERNEGLVFQLNVINNGAIDNVMPDICVETPVRVDASGFHALQFGSLPPAIAGWVNLVGSVQDLTVRAAVEGDRQYALQALALDPMCYHLEIGQIEAMLNEMLAAQQRWLPQFYPTE
ncbi:MAG: family 4 glycosyl hydrolase [Anaerolineae bacterium]